MKRPDNMERNRARAIHGHSTAKTPTYISWRAMRARITNPKHKDFPGWGGRGLDMDPRWHSYVVFLAEMGERPEGTTLGRIDNERGYWPDNARWETAEEQSRNRRTKMTVDWGGMSWPLAQLARSFQIDPQVFRYRLSKGWPIQDALTREVTHRNRHWR